MQHLEEKNTCPDCELVIHQSHPLQYISHDRTMQDIVYKLVPNLQESKCCFKCIMVLWRFLSGFLSVGSTNVDGGGSKEENSENLRF